ncbi:MAG TPA: PilZ domain-containing protein [Spirochaetota bacterium]|mgnify:CR=1 FL=1|nr:PilZ domain-containing protein [Spirochaetota bacterium]HPI90679.1 PilZ domain-containing protein [Spirochaetota bacterium]HPR49168.1 PilZ domain-containing protein [Spirochaetota bacterium]
MTEKRKYPRYACKLKVKFDYYEGNPEEIDIDISVSKKGKGFILDISKGGVFIVTNERVTIGSPIKLTFVTKKNKNMITGNIVRVGLLKNNPSEVARRFVQFSDKGDSYMAVEFNEPLEKLYEDEL